MPVYFGNKLKGIKTQKLTRSRHVTVKLVSKESKQTPPRIVFF